MSYRFDNGRSSPNPFLQGLYLLVAAIVLVGAVLLGAFLLSIAIGIGLVIAAIIMVRVWWMKRKLERAAGAAGEKLRSESTEQGRVIEVEYTVVEDEANDGKPE